MNTAVIPGRGLRRPLRPSLRHLSAAAALALAAGIAAAQGAPAGAAHEGAVVSPGAASVPMTLKGMRPLAADGSRPLPSSVLSADGRWRLVAENDAVRVEETEGSLRRVMHPALSLDRREQGRPAALLALPARRSFAVAFEALPELWEISLDPAAEPIFDGYVHDYRMGEAIAKPGFLGVRRTRLEEPLQSLAADGGAYVLGRVLDRAADAAGSGAGRARLVLVQLDVRRAIARFELDADPDLARAKLLQEDGRRVLLVPDRRGGEPLRFDLRAARFLPP